MVGIIFVQGYWIKSTVDNKEEQFSFTANQVLKKVADQIQRKELNNYYFSLLEVIENDTTIKPDNVVMSEVFKVETDEKSNETFIYSRGIFEEDYKISSNFLNFESDSIRFKKIVNRESSAVLNDENEDIDSVANINRMFRMSDFEREFIKNTVVENAAKIPIQQRVSEEYIRELLKRELKENELESDFEFGVYSGKIATKIKSDNFDVNSSGTYHVELFPDSVGASKYRLFVNLEGKRRAVLSSISLMAALSIIFTLIIVLTFSNALSQLIKQRQISQIKTDFINNMTHEFKTPIATIKLALDSMKNPKVRGDHDKMSRYLSMIREENIRMNSHVENVLRIAKLENNELDLKKEKLDLHNIIYEAIAHVELLVEDKQGEINTHFNASSSNILVNETHFTNIIVNILDNSIKYTPETEPPKIDIYTENSKNNVYLKISDHGIGMSRSVQRKIFEKFYREHTGDIHNVKGHGLGLAYVKRIIEDHNGDISVESTKGKGSTFTIKLPLIS